MNITIIGTGYVGLVTGTCLSKYNNVTCIDIDEKKIKKLNSGEITIYEPGLKVIFQKNIANNKLKFSSKLDKKINNSDLIFLALPTPSNEDGSADLKYVIEVAKSLSKIINTYKIIINKSTVPVGTTKKINDIFISDCSVKVDVISNPEFLREGVAVNDFMNPERIVIGTKSIKAIKIIRELYDPFVEENTKILIMDEESAELTKYAANSFLATKISFINEISQICDKTNANVDHVRLGIGMDSRIGNKFLNPGIGYGGSCFPKDVKALINYCNEIGYDFKILNSVERVNKNQNKYLISKILNYFNNDVVGKHFGIWGLSFKPETDDIREAPSLSVINQLLKLDAKIMAYDPQSIEIVREKLGNKIDYCTEPISMLKEIDGLIICTEWDEFKRIDLDCFKRELKSKLIFDGRNIYDVNLMKKIGIEYFSIGRNLI